MKTEQAVTEKIGAQLKALLGVPFRLTNETQKCEYTVKLTIGKYTLSALTKEAHGPWEKIASFELYPMINCCGICVSTMAEVIPAWRGKGLGTLLNSVRIDIAREDGYSLLMCTDVEANTYQRKILMRNGWTDIRKFLNKRTNNTVFVSCIGL